MDANEVYHDPVSTVSNSSRRNAAAQHAYLEGLRRKLEKINNERRLAHKRPLTLEEYIAMQKKPAAPGRPELNLYESRKREIARNEEKSVLDKAASGRAAKASAAASARKFAAAAAEAVLLATRASENASASAKKAEEIAATTALTPEIEAALKTSRDASTKASTAVAEATRAAAAAEKKAAEADATNSLELTSRAAATAESAASYALRKQGEAEAAAVEAAEAVARVASLKRAAIELSEKEAFAAKYDPAKVDRYKALLEEIKGEFMKDKTTKAKATIIDNALKSGAMPPVSLFTKKQKERIRAANLANVAGLPPASGGACRTRRQKRKN